MTHLYVVFSSNDFIYVGDKLIMYQMDDGCVIGMVESDQWQTNVTETANIEQSMVSLRWQRYISTGNTGRISVQDRQHNNAP